MTENNICTDCGYEGPEEEECPECGGDMVPADETEVLDEDEADEADPDETMRDFDLDDGDLDEEDEEF